MACLLSLTTHHHLCTGLTKLSSTHISILSVELGPFFRSYNVALDYGAVQGLPLIGMERNLISIATCPRTVSSTIVATTISQVSQCSTDLSSKNSFITFIIYVHYSIQIKLNNGQLPRVKDPA